MSHCTVRVSGGAVRPWAMSWASMQAFLCRQCQAWGSSLGAQTDGGNYGRLTPVPPSTSLPLNSLRVFCFFFFLISGLFIHSWLHCLCCCTRAFLELRREWGAPLSGCGARASHCGGLSCCGARAPGCLGLSGCGSRALEHRLSSCSAQA